MEREILIEFIPPLGIQVKRHRLEIEGRTQTFIDIVVVGSLTASKAENQQELGICAASALSSIVSRTHKSGQRVAFDMPTGSTPKPMWPELASSPELPDFWYGHEAEWMPEVDSPLDYEKQRRDILNQLGISITPILSAEKIEAGIGNYIPMYQIYPEDSDEPASVEQAALESANRYDEILHTLLSRSDIVSVGFHGVGVDGHGFGELQLFDMWPETWPNTTKSFVRPLNTYSYEGGLWRLASDGGFDAGNNALFQQRQTLPHVRFLMGLGRNILSRLDYCLEIFNNRSKFVPLAKTIESFRGRIHLENGETLNTTSNTGEGEQLLNVFKEYASDLYRAGSLDQLPGEDYRDAESCFCIAQIINRSLQRFSESDYIVFWRLINRYFGSHTPVSKMVQERLALGRGTGILVSADVIKGTSWEFLAK